MVSLANEEFVDLYLGDDFASVKGLPGEGLLASAPPHWGDALTSLRQRCAEHFDRTQEPEFSLVDEGRVLRVTLLQDLHTKPVFVISKSAVERIRPIDDLGLPDQLYETILAPSTRGLIFICGEMASGKTSTAASIVKARLMQLGGLAIAVEDPPEPLLHGVHGAGRCIQVPVSRRSGGYEEALIRALRSRADMLFVGEVRDTPTAAQVVQASINGHLIICTGHGGSIGQGLERLSVLAQPKLPNAMQILSQGITAVIHQALMTSPAGTKSLRLSCLNFAVSTASAIREKVRTGNTTLLEQDISQQNQRALWNAD